MKILVAIKRVVDFAATIRIKADESGIDTTNVKMVMNPFDEIAVEEAVRLKEKGIATDITVLSIGPRATQEIIRSALALGADKGILIEHDDPLEPLATAKILQTFLQRESYELVILGKQAIDTDNNQTGQILAGLMNWPQGTFASKIEVMNHQVKVEREIDGGLETLLLKLPAVITTDLRLNEPRYLSLPNIVQAKKKPIEFIPIADFAVDIHPKVKILKITPPKKRNAGIKVMDVDELLNRLKNEAQVIQ